MISAVASGLSRKRTRYYGSTMPDHRHVNAAHLPKPGGAYSVATVFDRLVFVSGQGAKDPQTDRLVGADIEAQTEQCLRNIEAILESAGSGLQHVLRCGVFLVDISEFQKMNAVYARVFGEHRPARTTIQAVALPAPGLRVEIDCIAYVP
jgi:2-iminobutanoate/2-iminopropanoate deaminase